MSVVQDEFEEQMIHIPTTIVNGRISPRMIQAIAFFDPFAHKALASHKSCIVVILPYMMHQTQLF